MYIGTKKRGLYIITKKQHDELEKGVIDFSNNMLRVEIAYKMLYDEVNKFVSYCRRKGISECVTDIYFKWHIKHFENEIKDKKTWSVSVSQLYPFLNAFKG